MVLIRVYLIALILCYFVVCILAESSNTTVTVHYNASATYTPTHTPYLSTSQVSLVLGSSSFTSSRHIPKLTATPSASRDVVKWSSMSSSVVSNGTDSTRRPRMIMPGGADLSSFGIVMVVMGGILVAVMIVCLLVICCRGRERGPERAHTPHHSNVKMKPWKTAELSTTNEITEDTIDNSNHPQSHQNSGLASTSPQLSPTSPTSNNNSLTTTESFRTLQTNPHGDLGDFGRKLSLGRQAYEPEPKASTEEDAAGHEPALEAKGESADMKVHYV